MKALYFIVLRRNAPNSKGSAADGDKCLLFNHDEHTHTVLYRITQIENLMPTACITVQAFIKAVVERTNENDHSFVPSGVSFNTLFKKMSYLM
jgi:hypothetical protein